MSVNGIQLLEFSKEKASLWDHTVCGDSVELQFSQHQKLKVHLKLEVLKQGLSLLETRKDDSKTVCQVRGYVKTDTGPVSIEITIFLDEIEDSDCAEHLNIGEITALIAFVRKDKGEFHWPLEQYLLDLEAINSRCRSMHSLDLIKFLKPRIICDFYGTQCDVKVEIAAVATNFTVTQIGSIPVHPTCLSQSHWKSKELLPSTGFLTFDITKKLVFLSETDSELANLPLIGIWVGGVNTVLHPYVWAACVRFLCSLLYKKRVCLPPLPFLIVIYNSKNSLPTFHDCICQSGNLLPLFTCYEGVSSVEIEKFQIPAMESRSLFVHLNQVNVHNSEFNEVHKSIEKIETKKRSSVTNCSEDIPQTMCEPQEKGKVEDPAPLLPNLPFNRQFGYSATAANVDKICTNPFFYSEKILTSNFLIKKPHFSRDMKDNNCHVISSNSERVPCSFYNNANSFSKTLPKYSALVNKNDCILCQKSAESKQKINPTSCSVMPGNNHSIFKTNNCHLALQQNFMFPNQVGTWKIRHSEFHPESRNQNVEDKKCSHRLPCSYPFAQEVVTDDDSGHCSCSSTHAPKNYTSSLVPNNCECYKKQNTAVIRDDGDVQLQHSSLSSITSVLESSHIRANSPTEAFPTTPESITKLSSAQLKLCLKASHSRDQDGRSSKQNLSSSEIMSKKINVSFRNLVLSDRAHSQHDLKIPLNNRSSIPVRIRSSIIAKNYGKVDSELFEIRSQCDVSNSDEITPSALQSNSKSDETSSCMFCNVCSEAKALAIDRYEIQKPLSASCSCKTSQTQISSTCSTTDTSAKSHSETNKSNSMTQQTTSSCVSNVASNDSVSGNLNDAALEEVKSCDDLCLNMNPNLPEVSTSASDAHSKYSNCSPNYAAFQKKTVSTMTSFIMDYAVQQDVSSQNPLSEDNVIRSDVQVNCSSLKSAREIHQRSEPLPRQLSCTPGDCFHTSSAKAAKLNGCKVVCNLDKATSMSRKIHSSWRNQSSVQIELNHSKFVESCITRNSDIDDEHQKSIPKYYESQDKFPENRPGVNQLHDCTKRNHPHECTRMHHHDFARMHHPHCNGHKAHTHTREKRFIHLGRKTECMPVFHQSCVVKPSENCDCRAFENSLPAKCENAFITYYGMTTQNATLTTRQYLHRYNVIPSEEELQRCRVSKVPFVFGLNT